MMKYVFPALSVLESDSGKFLKDVGIVFMYVFRLITHQSHKDDKYRNVNNVFYPVCPCARF